MYLQIKDKDKAVKFETKGSEIKTAYQGELNEGDEICIRLDGTNTLAVRLEASLQ